VRGTILEGRMDRRVRLVARAVEVSLEDGRAPADIVPVLSDAAVLARELRLQQLLIVSGLDDPASAEAVCMALEEIHAVGAPPFKIAFVAGTLHQYAVYHFAKRYAQRFGIAAKVLVSIRDAQDWLGVREEAPVPLR
jgi:hypothetical protein